MMTRFSLIRSILSAAIAGKIPSVVAGVTDWALASLVNESAQQQPKTKINHLISTVS